METHGRLFKRTGPKLNWKLSFTWRIQPIAILKWLRYHNSNYMKTIFVRPQFKSRKNSQEIPPGIRKKFWEYLPKNRKRHSVANYVASSIIVVKRLELSVDWQLVNSVTAWIYIQVYVESCVLYYWFASKEVHFVGSTYRLDCCQHPNYSPGSGEIEYQELPYVLTVEEAIEQSSFFPIDRRIVRGDVDKAMKQADYVFEGRLESVQF